MNFETANLPSNDGDTASQRRWQGVLDLGCPVEECGQRAVRLAEAPPRPDFEVMP